MTEPLIPTPNMANWSARITGKEVTNVDGVVRLNYEIIRGKDVVVGDVVAEGRPSDIQQIISDRVKSYAPEWEIADAIHVGQVLSIIVDGSDTVIEDEKK